MVKCTRLYSDGQLMVAKSESGSWFFRELTFNDYFRSYGWTKWQNLGQLKTVRRNTYKWENMNGNEITTHELSFLFQRCQLAFKLNNRRSVKNCKYRLPY